MSEHLQALDRKIRAACEEKLAAMGVEDPHHAMRRTLESTLDQMGWCQQVLSGRSRKLLEDHPVFPMERLPQNALVGCPGVTGAFTHMACEKLFPRGKFRFYEQFEEVVAAVTGGDVEFGVIPVENSSAGQVNQALELVGRSRYYINASTFIKVEHCLCAHPDDDPEAITTVISHPQALMQCEQYLKRRRLIPQRFSNTATAAKHVGDGGTGLGCICSRRSAELYGLKILQAGVQDHDENYTRFVCISSRNILLPGADMISLALSLPHAPGALHQLLTRFAACNLDLQRLQSMPIASRDFDVRFHLDFHGSILDESVVNLLSCLGEEFDRFVFLGNFLTVE